MVGNRVKKKEITGDFLSSVNTMRAEVTLLLSEFSSCSHSPLSLTNEFVDY